MQICGVSILRAGEVMEPALHEVCKDIRVGKILIQTNTDSGEPEVRYKLIFLRLCRVGYLDAHGPTITRYGDRAFSVIAPVEQTTSAYS